MLLLLLMSSRSSPRDGGRSSAGRSDRAAPLHHVRSKFSLVSFFVFCASAFCEEKKESNFRHINI